MFNKIVLVYTLCGGWYTCICHVCLHIPHGPHHVYTNNDRTNLTTRYKNFHYAKSVIDLAIKSKNTPIHYIMSFLHIACKIKCLLSNKF